MVQCVVNRLLSSPLECGFVSGALRWVTLGRTQRLPALRGDTQRVATPGTLANLLGARAERVPDCSSYLSRIPWSAADSGLSIHPRDSVDRAASALWAIDVCTRSGRASRCGPTLPQARLHALLNASAASESTTAGGLEAFSQGTAGTERFENASSEFRWNLNPLLPLSIELNVQRRHPGWLGQSSGFKRVDARQHKPVREHPLNHLSSFEMSY